MHGTGAWWADEWAGVVDLVDEGEERCGFNVGRRIGVLKGGLR